MFDPAGFDPPQHGRTAGACAGWRGGIVANLVLGAAGGLVMGLVLMPWFVYARAMAGATLATWLGAWLLVGLLIVPGVRAGRVLVGRLGWRRLAWLAGTLGVLLAAQQVWWLAYGWVPFRPVCLGSVRYEIVGAMNPVAVIHVEHWLRQGWGASAVKRDAAGQLLVSPILRSSGGDRVMNYIDKDGWRIAARQGIHWPPLRTPVLDCDAVAAAFMEGPWELERGWGFWPYNSLDASSPLARGLMYLRR